MALSDRAALQMLHAFLFPASALGSAFLAGEGEGVSPKSGPARLSPCTNPGCDSTPLILGQRLQRSFFRMFPITPTFHCSITTKRTGWRSCAAQYSTFSSVRPCAGAVTTRAVRFRLSRMRLMSSGDNFPMPTSISAPVMLRAILYRKPLPS